jgi:hypothetical protein
MGTTPEIIKRSQLAEYIDVTPESTSPTWERIGFGVEGKATDYAPEIDERQFIDEDSPNSSVKSYKPTSEFDISAAKNSPVFTFVDKLRTTRATYAAAETTYLEVRLYAPVEATPDTYEATQYKAAIAVSNMGDAASDPLTLTVSINGKGDPVQGTFAYATKTFTPTAA